MQLTSMLPGPDPGGRAGRLLGGVRLAAGQVVDAGLRGERIEAVGAPGTLPPAADHLDLSGYLLLPAPAEPRAHFDTALIAASVLNPTSDLAGALTPWHDSQGLVTRAHVVGRATEAALRGLTMSLPSTRDTACRRLT